MDEKNQRENKGYAFQELYEFIAEKENIDVKTLRSKQMVVTIEEAHPKGVVCKIDVGTLDQFYTNNVPYSYFQAEFQKYIQSNKKDLYGAKQYQSEKRAFTELNAGDTAYIFSDKKDRKVNQIAISVQGDTLEFYEGMEQQFDSILKDVQHASGQIVSYDFTNKTNASTLGERQEYSKAERSVIERLKKYAYQGRITKTISKKDKLSSDEADRFYGFTVKTNSFPREVIVGLNHEDPQVANFVILEGLSGKIRQKFLGVSYALDKTRKACVVKFEHKKGKPTESERKRSR